MSNKEKMILDIILGAIQREVTAYDYYYKSSQSSPFPETQSLFIQLAREEKKHREILIREYQTIKRMIRKEGKGKTYMGKEELSYFIPEEIPFRKLLNIPEVEISCVSLPTEFLGGDYFETMIIDNPNSNVKHLAFLLYDIMGHGLEVSSLKAEVRELFENLIGIWSRDKSILSPGVILTRLGEEIWQDCQKSSSFLEFFYALYDPVGKKLVYSSAGHPPPILLSNQGRDVKALVDTDLVMGIVKDKKYQDSYTKVESGDIFILFSDGVVEAFNPDEEMFEEKRLIQTVQENSQFSTNQITQRICKSIKEFTRGKPLTDELTLVLAKFK